MKRYRESDVEQSLQQPALRAAAARAG